MVKKSKREESRKTNSNQEQRHTRAYAGGHNPGHVTSKSNKTIEQISGLGAHRRVEESKRLSASELEYRVIVGRNPVKELLLHGSGRVVQLFVKNGDLDQRGREILLLAQDKTVSITERSVAFLDDMSGGAVHQGFIALAKPQTALSVADAVKQFGGRERVLIVAADGIADPHNLGAMFRAADCYGADALMWSKNRGSGQTTTVAKASVGASELVPFVEVSNLAQSLQTFKEAGFWVVACALAEGAATLFQFEWPDKTILLFGSEGGGVGRLLLERSDFIVKIPMRGRIDSLNVSQATAVFLNDWAAKGG